ELAAQRLDLDSVSDGLKVAHRFPTFICVAVCARLAVPRGAFPSPAERLRPWLRLTATISSPPERSRRVTVRPMSPVTPVPATRMRSPAGEHGVNGEDVVHRGHAHQVPGEAEAGPVDVDLGVEPDLAVALDGRRGIEGQGPGTVAHGQRAGHSDTV